MNRTPIHSLIEEVVEVEAAYATIAEEAYGYDIANEATGSTKVAISRRDEVAKKVREAFAAAAAANNSKNYSEAIEKFSEAKKYLTELDRELRAMDTDAGENVYAFCKAWGRTGIMLAVKIVISFIGRAVIVRNGAKSMTSLMSMDYANFDESAFTRSLGSTLKTSAGVIGANSVAGLATLGTLIADIVKANKDVGNATKEEKQDAKAAANGNVIIKRTLALIASQIRFCDKSIATAKGYIRESED